MCSIISLTCRSWLSSFCEFENEAPVTKTFLFLLGLTAFMWTNVICSVYILDRFRKFLVLFLWSFSSPVATNCKFAKISSRVFTPLYYPLALWLTNDFASFDLWSFDIFSWCFMHIDCSGCCSMSISLNVVLVFIILVRDFGFNFRPSHFCSGILSFPTTTISSTWGMTTAVRLSSQSASFIMNGSTVVHYIPTISI